MTARAVVMTVALAGLAAGAWAKVMRSQAREIGAPLTDWVEHDAPRSRTDDLLATDADERAFADTQPQPLRE